MIFNKLRTGLHPDTENVDLVGQGYNAEKWQADRQEEFHTQCQSPLPSIFESSYILFSVPIFWSETMASKISTWDHAANYRSFPTWEALIQFAKTFANEHVRGFLHIHVPGSLADNTQYNELREAFGLTPIY
jgi:hypothetical protein